VKQHVVIMWSSAEGAWAAGDVGAPTKHLMAARYLYSSLLQKRSFRRRVMLCMIQFCECLFRLEEPEKPLMDDRFMHGRLSPAAVCVVAAASMCASCDVADVADVQEPEKHC
jgi:hypothetical protein